MLDLLVRGGHLVIPGVDVVRADLGIQDGVVRWLGGDGPVPAARQVLDVGGLHVLPGLVDPHAHLGIFGALETEVGSETAQALAGGVTSLGVYLNLPGPHDDALACLGRLAPNRAVCDLFTHLVLRDEQDLAAIPRFVRQHGVTSFKVYMAGIPGLIDPVDDGFLLSALTAVRQAYPGHAALCLNVHAEDHSVVQRSVRTQAAGGPAPAGTELVAWEQANPAFAEAHAITRLASLVRQAKSSAYVVHVSSGAGLAALRRARCEGVRLYGETTSPYLGLAVEEHPAALHLKMVPPVRTAADREALWQGVADDSIEAIGTDNTTLTAAEKGLATGDLWQVVPGYPVYPVHAALVLDRWQRRGADDIPLARLAYCMSTGPARRFGLRGKGNLLPGYDADLAIVDLSRVRCPDRRYTRGDFLLAEAPLAGVVAFTVRQGRVVARDGELVETPPPGVLLAR